MEEQSGATFAGQVRQYNIALRMIASNSSLQIGMEDTEKLLKFRTIVDKQFITNQGELFEEAFTVPQDIFHFISQNFKDATIEDTDLIFTYGTINNVPRKVCIPLNWQPIDKVKSAHLKIKKIQDVTSSKKYNSFEKWIISCIFVLAIGFTYYVRLSQIQTAKLARDNEELAMNQRQLRQNLTLFIYHQQQNYKILKQDLEERQKRWALLLQQQQQAFQKQLNQHVNDQISKWKETQSQIESLHQKYQQIVLDRQNKIKRHISQTNQYIDEVQIVDKLGHHPNNSHRIFYSVTPTSPTSIKISKSGQTGWHNFVNKYPIRPQIGTIRYKVKILKSLAQMIGFTTDKGLGIMQNYYSPESVYYWNYENGRFFEQGKYRHLSDAGLNVGDTVDVTVDFEIGKFQWKKNGTKLAQCKIPETMEKKSIYLSISMVGHSNEVEVFL